MKKKILLIALFAVLLLPRFALADAPPPQPFLVYVKDNRQLVSRNFSAVLLSCKPSDGKLDGKSDVIDKLNIKQDDLAAGCTWTPQSEPQNCSGGVCKFNWLGGFKFAAYLPSLNKTFISNAMNRNYLGHYGRDTSNYYQAKLGQDGSAKLSETVQQGSKTNLEYIGETGSHIFVVGTTVTVTDIIISLLVTLILELIIVLIFTLIKKFPKRILLGVLIGNIISVPLLWALVLRFYSTLYPAEIAVVVFEAWFIKYFSRHKLGWGWCLLISFVMNLVSFLFGPWLYRFLM